MSNLFTKKILVVVIFFLAIFLSPESVFAAASPDAIATRVIPNPDHLSPLSWYQANIKKQGSPQVLLVDGYEAIRDGRTVYVNAANIDLANNKFYTNIYLISFNQDVEQATQDIFGQLLSHWKFNTNVPAEQKDKIRQDTKRLADLAEIKSALNNYQKTHDGDFPSLAAGSYVAGKSLSVWPSWQATLAKELGITLPLDPVNKLGTCPQGYDATTCWDQKNKRFAGVPANSQAYIYTYNGVRSYNVCALMQSGYLTTLDQGACAGSAVGYKVACQDITWTYKVNRATVCSNQTITETSDCGNTRNTLYGTKTDTIWTPNVNPATVCSNQTITETGNCGGTRNTLHGAKCCDTTWTPNVNPATVCSNLTVTETSNCGNTRNTLHGAKCCVTCAAANQPNCQASAPANSEAGAGVCCGGQTCYKCQNNYTWSGGVCAADTQTVNCTAKPANTNWNVSSTVLQTWTGSAWQPANVSAYDTTAGTCKYKCQAGFKLDGGSCVNYFSCLDLKNHGISTNGQYKIDPDGAGGVAPFNAYCDMTTDGGGWTLIMRNINAKFGYNDSYWTNSNTLDGNNFDFTTAGGKSKYQSFNTVSFSEIRTSDTNNFNNFYKHNTGQKNNAGQLFSGPAIIISQGTLNDYFNDRTVAVGQHWGAPCGSFESDILTVGINISKDWGPHSPVYSVCDWGGGARFGQVVNGFHGGTGDIQGQGWGARNLAGNESYNFSISQLLWVR